MTRARILFVVTFLCVFALSLSVSLAQEKSKFLEIAEPIRYATVYADENGKSHFAGKEISFVLKEYAPPALPISVSKPAKATGVVFLSSPGGWFGDWHPAPRRQFLIVLKGVFEIEISDGEKRRFGPGEVLLVEDTTGQGHIARMVGTERVYVMAVPVPLPAPLEKK
jgi:quercetin dioxygenase-like cupin family protein